VEELTYHLELPMLIYLEALADGPAPIQLRAAFHIGMAHEPGGSTVAAPLLAARCLCAQGVRAVRMLARVLRG
jgi:hypothetical protein